MARHFLQIDASELKEFTEQFSELRKEFNDTIEQGIIKVAREFLADVKVRTPRKTGNLISHWDTDNVGIQVQSGRNGHWVWLYNKAEYALEVEQGHYSYNQFNVGGEPYVVKNRTVPYLEGNSDPTFVYGRFYLKQTENLYKNGKMEQIVQQEITKILEEKGW